MVKPGPAFDHFGRFDPERLAAAPGKLGAAGLSGEEDASIASAQTSRVYLTAPAGAVRAVEPCVED